MDQDDENAPKGAPPNRTIQIDALSDVQLVDNSQEGDAAEGAPLISRAPPPLPPRKPAQAPSGATRIVGFVLVIAITGGLGALGAHFLVPAAPAPTVPSPPEAAEAAVAEPEVRHIRIEDEFVIHAEDPDAGLAAAEPRRPE